MSLAPANIVITFIANYVGTHRVCYRLGNTGDYTCVSTDCSVLGSCEAEISIFVEQENCENVQYTGYIQAACEDIFSVQGRVPWAVEFTPLPSCKSYNVVCTRLNVGTVITTNGGNGYSPTPTVNFVGGGGTASATASVGNGAITSINIAVPGSGYVNGVYMNVTLNPVGGFGSGATANITVSGGSVTSVTLVSGGTGFLTTANIVIPNALQMGESDPSVEAQINYVSNYRKITGISINSSTSFTSIPDIVITDSTGVGAVATAVMEECPLIQATGCTGSPLNIAQGVLTGFGENVVICGFTDPTLDDAYDVNLNGNCLCNCTVATIGVTGSVGTQVRYTYNKCALEVRTGLLTVGGSPSSIIDCVVPGSLVFQILTEGTNGTVSYGADCS